MTWVQQVEADGGVALQTSRRQRKGLAAVPVASEELPTASATDAIRHSWSRLWAPRQIGWWIAVLFMIGSALFALGGAQTTWPKSPSLGWFDPALTGLTFFVGSLFFTSAAYLQYLESINSDLNEVFAPEVSRPLLWRFLGWHPRNLGYFASVTQLAGTVLFNLDTADALITGLGWKGEDLLVWTPDMLGSVCFLVASQAALMEISHDYCSWQPRNLSWWIGAINMLGSGLFMISAVASLVEPGPVVMAPWTANFSTFAGAACFFVGAYLLIPEQFELQASNTPSRAQA